MRVMARAAGRAALSECVRSISSDGTSTATRYTSALRPATQLIICAGKIITSGKERTLGISHGTIESITGGEKQASIVVTYARSPLTTGVLYTQGLGTTNGIYGITGHCADIIITSTTT